MRASWNSSGQAFGLAVLLFASAAPAALGGSEQVLAQPTQAGWREVVSAEGGFRIAFPSEPKFAKKDIETGAGRLTTHSHTLDEGPISFHASWLEFAPHYVRDLGPVRVLNGAKESFFKRFKGTVVKERIVQLGVAPGRDTVFETEDGVRIRLAMYLRGYKLVQALVICEADLMDSSDAKRFFDSLKWE
jgi:hypothetical protein